MWICYLQYSTGFLISKIKENKLMLLVLQLYFFCIIFCKQIYTHFAPLRFCARIHMLQGHGVSMFSASVTRTARHWVPSSTAVASFRLL